MLSLIADKWKAEDRLSPLDSRFKGLKEVVEAISARMVIEEQALGWTRVIVQWEEVKTGPRHNTEKRTICEIEVPVVAEWQTEN